LPKGVGTWATSLTKARSPRRVPSPLRTLTLKVVLLISIRVRALELRIWRM